jgi:predicted RNA-binding Zn ribbon-like protein
VTVAFQPGDRAPAPAPLDLVQDFVNTEIPDFNRDDIATPAELAAWLRARSLIAPDDTVDADVFVAARALRTALRELALANTLGVPPDADRRAGIDAALAAFPLVLRAGSDGLGFGAAGTGARRGLSSLVAIVATAQAGGAWERLKACRQKTCGWLFYDASRNRSSNWCSMRVCGGREKSRAYRRRHSLREDG